MNIIIYVLNFILLFTSVISHRIYSVGEQKWTIINSNQSIKIDEVTLPSGIYSEIEHKDRVYMFYEYNDMKYRWIGNENWTYYTDFELKSSDLVYKSIYLVLNGVDTISRIYINNNFIGSTMNMFVKYRFNIKHVVQAGVNSIFINFTSPITEAGRIASLLPYKIPLECWPNVYHGECHINKLRKMQASFAWDWGPAIPSVGLWKPVELDLSNGIQISSVGTFLTSEEEYWRLTGRVWFDIDEDAAGTLSAELFVPQKGYIRTETTVSISTSSKEARITLLVPKTKVVLWWPNGYGDQNLYDLTVIFRTTYETLSKTIQIGFRTIEIMEQPVNEDPSKGRTFYFRINNVPIFAKGSNWIPSDIFPERTEIEERVTRLLQAAVEANFNMIRVWGGGVYESDLFYSLCDKYGILIWHDLMFACNMYPSDAGFLDMVKVEVEQQIKRLQHHPSIAVWAGNNENEVALRQNWYDTEKNFTLYRSDYLKLYVGVIKPIIQTLDPQRPYVTSSPSNGIQTIREGYVSKNPQDNLYGDVHYYNYIGNLWNWEVFPKPRFSSEYGIQSLPAYGTLINAMNITNAVWGSDVLAWKQHSPERYFPMLFQIQMNLPQATTLKDIIYLSQINQAMSIKSETEHYRRFKSILLSTGEGLTMGALYWQLNDVWEAPSWSSIDFLGKWKMLHYYAKSFFSNIIVSPMLDAEDILSVFVVSDLLISVMEADLFIDVFSWSSFMPITSQRYSIQFGPNQSKEVLKGNFSYFLGTCTNRSDCFMKFTLSLGGDLKNMVIPNNYLFPVNLKKANFPHANVVIKSLIMQSKFEGSLTLATDKIALFVWIECAARGEDGITFSDNGFHMVQTEKTIKVTLKNPIFVGFLKNLLITNLKPEYT